MQTYKKSYKVLFVFPISLLVVFFISFACSYISPYSHFAYQQVTSLKVEALELMDKATDLYTNHETEINELKSKIEKAYEYDKGRPKNELSTKQWEILKDPDRNLLGGFMIRWEKETKLSTVFIKEAKGLVADAFDTISGLESGKIKEGDVE